MTRAVAIDVDLQQRSWGCFVGWKVKRRCEGITREESEREECVEGYEQRGVVEVMMAAPAPVTPWLCFPVQAVLGEGGRVRGESSRFGVGFGVRWRGTQGLQVLRMENEQSPYR